MKYKPHEQGFSILEMLVAMSITIGLTGTLFYFFKQSQDSFVVESARTEMNQNFRAALDLMARDIQAAGAGIPMFLGPIASKDGGGTNSNPSLNPPDAILLLYGNSSFSPVTVKAQSSYPAPTSTSSTIYTDIPTTAFAPGNYILYTPAQSLMQASNLTDYAEFSLFNLPSTSAIGTVSSGGTVIGNQLTPSTFSINPSDDNTYWNHTMSFPSSTSLRVVPLDEVIEYAIDTTSSELRRNRNKAGWVTVARNIFNMQVRYQIETYDDSTATYTASWIDQVNQAATNNRALIRSVEVTLFGRTQMSGSGDRQGQRAIAQTLEVAPRNLNLPGFAPNR
ncbi:MAG: prepilin-type N-terminal cleavage/methylation domain-containing protein [Acidobacteria bacterium]|nr:prepilin-type N-terminal cleavage/methylation domain-containing protein [Acidobacteriota bacterium]